MYNPEFKENLMEILEKCSVHDAWMSMFQNYPDLLRLLHTSISTVEENLQYNDKPMIPERSKLLQALSRCPPRDVKVVLLGHGPISDASLATGFSFSFPEGEFIDKDVGQRDFGLVPGKSLADLHDVLVEAGYLERGADYDGCHEVWADRGVLLLNAALTYNKEHEHFPMWKEFVSKLLFFVALYSKHKPVFFLCWGTNAEVISKQLVPQLEWRGYVQKIDDGHHSKEVDRLADFVVFTGHHPTWPRDDNQFRLQAKNQFIAIKNRYSDLFELPKLTEEEKKDEMKDTMKVERVPLAIVN